jgi:protein disulfide-isomerase A1
MKITKICMLLAISALLVSYSLQQDTTEEEKKGAVEDEDEKVDPNFFEKFRYVENLDSISFNPFVKKQQYSIVYFYLPGCQKCAEFSPHFNASAESIKTNSRDSSVIAFGRVNCSEQEELAKRFEIRRYPTLVLFKSKDPEKSTVYWGEQSRIPLERTLRRMIDSVSLEMKSIDHIEELRDFNDAMVIYIGKPEGDKYRSFIKEAEKTEFDGTYFSHCAFPSCANYLKGEEGDIVIIKDFDEKHNLLKPGFTDKEFKHFIEQKYYPDVHDFNEITYFMTFDRLTPSLYLFRDSSKKEEVDRLYNDLKSIAPDVKTKVKLVHLDVVNPIEKIISAHFGINAEDLPIAVIFEAGKVRTLQYRLKNDLNAETIKTFIKGFLDKTIDPLLKSESPRENGGIDEHGIKYVVGSEFEAFVKDPTKDVVIMFYTDECVHCEDHYPKYHELAKTLGENPNIVFGKLNYSKNETKKIYTDRYPGIFIWPSENKDEILFKEELKVENLLNFVVGHASNPLHIHEDL